MLVRALAVLVLAAAAHTELGDAGLILLAAATVLYLLLRTRPFTTCAYCRGHGSRARLFGSPVRCSACSGTRYGTRAERRNATSTAPKNHSNRR